MVEGHTETPVRGCIGYLACIALLRGNIPVLSRIMLHLRAIECQMVRQFLCVAMQTSNQLTANSRMDRNRNPRRKN
jgi:hypothetical protein